MRIDARHLLAASAAVLALSACTNADGRFDLSNSDPTWGDANRATMAAQVIDPNPVYENPIPPTSAVNAVRAIDAYAEGNVEEVESLDTTEGGGGGPN